MLIVLRESLMFTGYRRMISPMACNLLTFLELGAPAESLEYKNGLYYLQIRRHRGLIGFTKEKRIDRAKNRSSQESAYCALRGKGWLAERLVLPM